MSALIDTQTRKLRAQLLGAMVRREAGEPAPQRLHFRRSVEPEEAAPRTAEQIQIAFEPARTVIDVFIRANEETTQ